MKRLTSLALAGAMAMTMVVPAFAANTASELSQSTTITGTTEVPTISVTVPDTGAVVVNPYKLEVSVSGTDVTDQIISATQYLENASNVAIEVKASVTGTKEGNAVFATASTQGGKAVTTNSAFMYFEIILSDDNSSEPTWPESFDKTNVNQLLVGDTENAAKSTMVTMAAGDGSDAAASNGYAAFHLAGDVADKLTTAWAATDKFGATIAFTFTPAISAPASGG